ncbi:sugar phosphate isomerase/epimerase family protein [Paenibacillus xerothermodurans]|uniref:Sugar phosphate isomerase/epimerase n=1 Tax=Paenibacillus xerothermodurans TaxID=1977292 RepID=A0A2W1NB61_PAEXE|nr:TIM barrel protein [Paenibacillus xerothermodurans]PZE21657.1 sugar phosphate isomerase/epimerase [Paenibacillus xerothermodurans]
MDKGDYSFSTCWNIKRHTAGRSMIEEIKSLGFHNVELNYNVDDQLLTTIEPMVERGEIRISSVHNVFPFVTDKEYDTDSVMLGFDDEAKRSRSVELLLRSMEYAQRYGVKAVVVHPGEVPFTSNIDAELKQLYRERGKDSEAYRTLWQTMMERRQSLSPHYLDRIQKSLEQACEHAARKGWNVTIGIETRSRCYQMPTLQEAELLCERLNGSGVKLWFDIGHAMMMERMGLYNTDGELDRVKHHVFGVHIHETLELSDHWCPYIHSKDLSYFDKFLDIIRRAEVKVYELKAACRAEEIHASHELITGKMQAQ